MEDDEIRRRLGELQGADFAQTAIAAALITFLQTKGLITPQEQNDACDAALLKIEETQGTKAIAEHPIFETARKQVEAFLPKRSR